MKIEFYLDYTTMPIKTIESEHIPNIGDNVSFGGSLYKVLGKAFIFDYTNKVTIIVEKR